MRGSGSTSPYISYYYLGEKLVDMRRANQTDTTTNGQYRLEQDHRGIKQRYYPMRGFGSFEGASRFCTAFDEQRDYFRYRAKAKEKISLSEQRRLFGERFGALQYLLMAA